MKFIDIFSLTDAGLLLAGHLHTLLKKQAEFSSSIITVLHRPKPFSDAMQQSFTSGHVIIAICATGIVIRSLAAVIQDKMTDPAVLVLDEFGQYVIPLLSGHEGGANDLSFQISELLVDAKNVQTTAKAYVKPIYTLGLGCERDCPKSFIEDVVNKALAQISLTMDDISTVSSIDIKADERALIDFSAQWQKPFQCFTKEVLSGVYALLSTRSDYVFNTVGVYGVAESAALISAKKITAHNAELVVNKLKNTKATCAISRSFMIE